MLEFRRATRGRLGGPMRGACDRGPMSMVCLSPAPVLFLPFFPSLINPANIYRVPSLLPAFREFNPKDTRPASPPQGTHICPAYLGWGLGPPQPWPSASWTAHAPFSWVQNGSCVCEEKPANAGVQGWWGSHTQDQHGAHTKMCPPLLGLQFPPLRSEQVERT